MNLRHQLLQHQRLQHQRLQHQRPRMSPTGMSPTSQTNRLVMAMGPMGLHTNLSWARTTGFDKTHIYEHLNGPDQITGDPIPQLATRFEMRPDGLAFTLELEEGVQFHHGWGEFTAEDVEHSFVMTMQEGSISDESQLFRDNVKGYDLQGKYKIIVEQNTPESFNIPYFGAALHGSFVINSKAYWDAEGEDGYSKLMVGTGPYRMVSRDLGVSLLAERVEDHWRKTGEFEEIEMFFISEEATRLAMLLAAEAHIALLPRDLLTTAKKEGMTVAASNLPSGAVGWFFGGQYYGKDTKDLLEKELASPWVGPTPDDPTAKKVRQAMNKAINRQEVIDEIFLGDGNLQRSWGFFPTLPGFNPQWDADWEEMYGYDPVRAKELLAEAGYPDGFEVGITLSPSGSVPEIISIGETLGQYFEAIGLDVRLENWEGSQMFQGQRQYGFGGMVFYTTANYRDPQVTLRLYNDPVQGLVHTFETDKLGELFAKLSGSIDAGERETFRRQMGDEKFYNFGEIPFIFAPAQVAVNPEVVGEYIFPGSPREFFSHFEFMKAAQRK